MRITKLALILACIALLFLVGCATSPEAESRRLAIEADIDAILSQPLDPAGLPEMKRCLADNDYRHFRALDERHILFEGRSDRLWVNTLRGRCSDLRYGDVLVVRSFSGMRLCDMDRFAVADWFDWPWYRRWPWQWGGSWHTGMSCTLGKFQPVTADQVAEIEAVLDRP